MTGRFRLGVDFGTSSTVAVLEWPDGRTRPLLFDGTPLLSSAVFSAPDRGLLIGREAVHSARAQPERFEPNPKRRIDEGTVLLGDTELPVVELVAAVLRRVAAEARTVAHDPVLDVTLTHPAAWGQRRRGILTEAARRAGFSNRQLVAEPVAAATYFTALPGAKVPEGGCVVVYDFGAGTFDASVVRRTGAGFDVLASDGLPDTGGLDLDASVVAHLAARYAGTHPEAWHRLDAPRTTADRRSRRVLWEDARTAKEVLSRSAMTLIPVPLVDEDAPLGREELERLIAPILARTVAMTLAVVRTAGIRSDELAGVFLVGGSSRIPAVATLLHQTLGVAPTAIEQPELVVSEGSLRATAVRAPQSEGSGTWSSQARSPEPWSPVPAEPQLPAGAESLLRVPTEPVPQPAPPTGPGLVPASLPSPVPATASSPTSGLGPTPAWSPVSGPVPVPVSASGPVPAPLTSPVPVLAPASAAGPGAGVRPAPDPAEPVTAAPKAPGPAGVFAFTAATGLALIVVADLIAQMVGELGTEDVTFYPYLLASLALTSAVCWWSGRRSGTRGGDPTLAARTTGLVLVVLSVLSGVLCLYLLSDGWIARNTALTGLGPLAGLALGLRFLLRPRGDGSPLPAHPGTRRVLGLVLALFLYHRIDAFWQTDLFDESGLLNAVLAAVFAVVGAGLLAGPPRSRVYWVSGLLALGVLSLYKIAEIASEGNLGYLLTLYRPLEVATGAVLLTAAVWYLGWPSLRTLRRTGTS
ncbi:Hsp70 family protein [Longispora sp. NPDC051575]|uniref:Hsp70 family protein n=1 Tax=Longispora sp. NPDC051575 TaxID=3154943 RepID=UPI0034392916